MNTATIPLEQYQSDIKKLHDEIAYLKEQLTWFHRQVFGKRSEKIVDKNTTTQIFLPFDLPNANVEIEKEQTIPAHTRRQVKKNKSDKIVFPEHLPIERIVLDVKEEEKVCSITSKPFEKIGEEVSQRLAFKPGSYYIKETVRPKYATPKGCEEGILIAPLPESFLSRSKVDESLLADILVKKFADHIPLYRQAEMLLRENIQISRQLLSQWVVKSGLLLKPLFDEMTKKVIESKNVFMDEVPVDMLKPGNGKVHQAYMWVLVGGTEANPPYRVYNFRTDRCHNNAAELLKNYHGGVLHSDKYGAYEALASKKQFVWCPCWAHIRRKFLDGEAGDPNFVKLILRKIRYLFMFERIAWGRSEEERLRIRKVKETPIIDDIITLVKDRLIKGNALPKSKFKEALGYFLGLVPYLKNYTLHSQARIDNNVAERAVRPLAIGRKNWLFLGSEEGGEAAAVVLSLVQTCRALSINPREYLEDIMRRIMSHNFKKLGELLPDQWLKSHPD